MRQAVYTRHRPNAIALRRFRALYVYIERRRSEGSPLGPFISMTALDFRVKLSDVRAGTASEANPRIDSCPLER